jgi:hypothetical protein
MMAAEEVSRRVEPSRDQLGCSRCWILIRRAVLTHDALPGERLSSLVSGIDVIREFQDAYGYTDARPPRFTPTPRDVSNMLPALGWLCWLRKQRDGERDFLIVTGRARNKPWWEFSQRHQKSERQVQRWLDGAIAAIYWRFQSEVWKLEPARSDV